MSNLELQRYIRQMLVQLADLADGAGGPELEQVAVDMRILAHTTRRSGARRPSDKHKASLH